MNRLDEMMDLSGRGALVTGGAGHLGRVIAETLVEMGAEVAIADLDLDPCTRVAEELDRKGPGSAWPLRVDLADVDSTKEAVRAAAERGKGNLSVLVHAAAFTGATRTPGWATATLAEQTVEAWDAALRVNLTSAFVLAQEAAPALIGSPGASVILVSSIYGVVGPDPRLYAATDLANPVGYGASKGALLQLVRYLATMLAPDVRVNALSPGGIERGQPEAFVARYVDRTPLRRMAREEDMKGAIAYLASDLSAYVTGQNLIVDGGWTTW
jgi:NAD(P)-dependent dehydrogenase (short-subunit alcohol dehydrogenase family)